MICRNFRVGSNPKKEMKPIEKTAILIFLSLIFSCSKEKSTMQEAVISESNSREFFVVPGKDEAINPELIIKGKVLISYSDCNECHKEERDATGPSFLDIAKRYPIRQVYIDLLARKVISGGSGVWGYPVMRAHPELTLEEAQAMVAFILSLEKN